LRRENTTRKSPTDLPFGTDVIMGKANRPDRLRIDIAAIRKATLDPRFGSQLGKLEVCGALTQLEADVGRRIGAIYHRHDKAIGSRRNPKPASFEVGLGKSPEATESARERDLAEMAREDFDALAWLLKPYGTSVRDALVRLCVDDRAVAPYVLPDGRQAGIALARQAASRQARISSILAAI
jgi:hypothetical protein